MRRQMLAGALGAAVVAAGGCHDGAGPAPTGPGLAGAPSLAVATMEGTRIGSASGSEGAAVKLSATAPASASSFRWSAPAGCTLSGQSRTGASLSCADNGSFEVSLALGDAGGASVTTRQSIVIKNAAPAAGEIKMPELVRAGSSFAASLPFTDKGKLDTHTATWAFNSSYVHATKPGTVSESNGSGTASLQYAFPRGGFYDVKATVADKDGGKGVAEKWNVIAYDPNAGTLQAVGSVFTPAGSYANDPGGAIVDFGLEIGYPSPSAQAPAGRLAFGLPGGGVFRATSFRYLVVEGDHVYAEGNGTIDGRNGYSFYLHAVSGGDFAPEVRFKIEDRHYNYVFDNDGGTALEEGGRVRVVR
ncbi:MAG TPA: hypothetical protein VKA84_08460 [Gemmatimonadaceae bacterium]|nr:hypothetical protein [Gemmatimonadaceae bacterium]